MRISVTNNSKALQGLSTLEGTVWIKPGASKTVSVEDTTGLERLPFIEIEYSADGVPVGDLPAPPKSLLDKAKAGKGAPPEVSMALKKDELLKIARREKVAVETDDNKADLVRKITAARA